MRWWTIFLKMSPSEKAAWYGAVVASFALFWNAARDVVGWFKRGPRLKISVYHSNAGGPDEFYVEITNTRPTAANIESVKLHCLAKRLFFFQKKVDHEEMFGLACAPDDAPPNVTIADGHHWEARLSQCRGLSSASKSRLASVNAVCIEIREAHRRRPYRRFPETRRFLDWLHGSKIT
jgi:hypothetical protein